jgi:sec-independent protein translocase protein TatA
MPGIANIGLPQILVVLVIIMLLFGAKRLPEIGGSLGKGIRSFKSSVTGEDEIGETENKEVAVKSGEDNS